MRKIILKGGQRIMNIYQKLIEVRKNVNYLQKENKSQQYAYVSSSQALAAVREKMNELGVLLVPGVIGHKVSEQTVEYFDKDGHVNKKTTTYFTELDMTMTWINAEDPQERIETKWYGQGVDIAGEKGVGKALTYAEKYFMLKFFNIPTDKDDPDSFQAKTENETISSKAHENTPQSEANSKGINTKTELKCEVCGAVISEKVAMYSTSNYKKKLCVNCQKKQ